MAPRLVPWHGLTPHTAGRVGGREGRRERERHLLWSPTLLCPIVQGPAASLRFTPLSSLYAWVCVLLEESGDGGWAGEHTGVRGCFAIWPIPRLGWEREKQRECGHERRAEKAVWKMPVLYKLFNLSLLGILFSLNFERKTTIVARWSDLIPM